VIGLFLLLLMVLSLQQQQLALHLAPLLEEPRPGALDVLGRLALLEVRPPVVLDLVVRSTRQAARDRRPSVFYMIRPERYQLNNLAVIQRN
jgi:hypothetical protein